MDMLPATAAVLLLLLLLPVLLVIEVIEHLNQNLELETARVSTSQASNAGHPATID